MDSLKGPSTLQKIFNPLSLDSKVAKHKKEYIAASIAIGIFTIGMGHAIYGLSRLIGKVSKQNSETTGIKTRVDKNGISATVALPKINNIEDFKQVQSKPAQFEKLQSTAKKRLQSYNVEYLVSSVKIHDHLSNKENLLENGLSELKKDLASINDNLASLNITANSYTREAKATIESLSSQEKFSDVDLVKLDEAFKEIDDQVIYDLNQMHT